MNKTALSIITSGLIIGVGIIFLGGPISGSETASTEPGQNIEIRDGVQYVTIDAKGGYFPRVSSAQAGIPTKLIVKTDGTYDCSASLAIHSIGYQKILPQTGETEIDIGTQKSGETLQGVCGMGMFSFQIKF